MSQVRIVPSPRPLRRALLTLWVVACVASPGPDPALAEQSSSDAAELMALLSLRDTASYEAVAPRRRGHFRLAIDGVVHRVSRTRADHPGWLSEVVIESDPAARGDSLSVKESWTRLLCVARARYGMATEGAQRFPASLKLAHGTASTHRWLLPGRSIDLQTRCVPRTPRGGETCSALLRVNRESVPAAIPRP